MSRRNAQRILRRLEAGGWLLIDVQRGRRSSGSYSSNVYWLRIPDKALSSFKRDKAASDLGRVEAVKPDTEGAEIGHHGPVNVTPKVGKPDIAVSEEYSENNQRTLSEYSVRASRADAARREKKSEEMAKKTAAARDRKSQILWDLYNGHNLPPDDVLTSDFTALVGAEAAAVIVAELRAEEAGLRAMDIPVSELEGETQA